MDISAIDKETPLQLKHLNPQLRLSIARVDEALTKILDEAQTALFAPPVNNTEQVWNTNLNN